MTPLLYNKVCTSLLWWWKCTNVEGYKHLYMTARPSRKIEDIFNFQHSDCSVWFNNSCTPTLSILSSLHLSKLWPSPPRLLIKIWLSPVQGGCFSSSLIHNCPLSSEAEPMMLHNFTHSAETAITGFVCNPEMEEWLKNALFSQQEFNLRNTLQMAEKALVNYEWKAVAVCSKDPASPVI